MSPSATSEGSNFAAPAGPTDDEPRFGPGAPRRLPLLPSVRGARRGRRGDGPTLPSPAGHERGSAGARSDRRGRSGVTVAVVTDLCA